MDKRKRGRPKTAHNVQITPEFRDNPDIEKLGRALIAVAISIAKKKAAEEMAEAAQTAVSDSEGDGMT